MKLPEKLDPDFFYPSILMACALIILMMVPDIRENDILRVGSTIILLILYWGYLCGYFIIKEIRELKSAFATKHDTGEKND